jgi:hypothetical protein
MYDVFLSYSRRDAEIVTRVQTALESAGLRVWIDQMGIPPGTANWRGAIQAAIRDSRCFVTIFSPGAIESRWVQEEIDYAALLGKPFFAVLGAGEESQSVPFGYSRHQWADVRDARQFQPEMTKLIARLRDTLAQPDEPGPPPAAAQHSPPPPAASQPAAAPSAPRSDSELFVSPLPDIGWLNPLHWLRWLQWVFLTPAVFQGDTSLVRRNADIKASVRWLTNTLTWLPLLILALGLSTGVIYANVQSGNQQMLGWTPVLVIGAWLIGGAILMVLDWVEHPIAEFVILVGSVGVGSFGGFGFMALLMATITNEGLGYFVTFGFSLPYVVALIVALSLTFALRHGQALQLGIGAGTIVALALITANETGASLVAVAAVVGGIVIGLAWLLGWRIRQDMARGQASLIGRAAFGLLVLMYAVFVWYCFLGGYDAMG